MGDLFDYQARRDTGALRPLADRMRPEKLEEFVGHRAVVGEGTVLQRALARDRLFSTILWGPPGCGKTTLARLIAGETRSRFIQFSAVLSGVREIREVIASAREEQKLRRRRTVLFVDEIHRFNKAQQDAFLHHVESGLITLIGATTENPSFEIIAPLLSRCRVLKLERLEPVDIREILKRALDDSARGLGASGLELSGEAMDHLVRIADGDARTALNGLEIASELLTSGEAGRSGASASRLTVRQLAGALQRKAAVYDKAGEAHFDQISAFHKSLRGSDPDAGLYWLARMLAGGEDPLYIARRMVRCASEDIGNADPTALRVALNAMEAFRMLGSPEGELALAQAAVYLATAPKSNRVYEAMTRATREAEKGGDHPVPLHLRNAPTELMRGLGYAKGYRYAHDCEGAYVAQDYLPDALRGRRFYHPSDRGYEKTIGQRLAYWRRLRRGMRRDEDDR